MLLLRNGGKHRVARIIPQVKGVGCSVFEEEEGFIRSSTWFLILDNFPFLLVSSHKSQQATAVGSAENRNVLVAGCTMLLLLHLSLQLLSSRFHTLAAILTTGLSLTSLSGVNLSEWLVCSLKWIHEPNRYVSYHFKWWIDGLLSLTRACAACPTLTHALMEAVNRAKP